jgi:hypothetical protein
VGFIVVGSGVVVLVGVETAAVVGIVVLVVVLGRRLRTAVNRRKQHSNKRLIITFSLTFVDLCIIVPFIKKYPTGCNHVANFLIPYLYEAQHVSGDTPPIIKSIKLYWQPLVFHTWKVVVRVVGGRCQAMYTNYTYKQPSTCERPEAASAVLCS